MTGPLLEGVDEALVDLLGTTSTGTADQIQESVETLVDAVVATLTGTSGTDQQAAADAIASQLQGALDPAVLTQVLAGIGLENQSPDTALGDLIDSLQQTAQELVDGLLGIGGGTPDPAQVQEIVDQITAALAGGDPAALQALLSDLLGSLPGGSSLSLSTLTGLVDEIISALQDTLGAGRTIVDVIGDVDDAVNGGGPAATPTAASVAPTISGPSGYFTSTHPRLRGNGTPGATVTVRTSTGTVLGSATVSSAGTFAVTSRKLKIALYRVTATQVEPGRTASPQSATRTFRVVSAKPVIKTKSRKKFATHRPTITGLGYPKSRVVLRSSTGKKLGSATVRPDGTWKIKSKRLGSGTRKIKAVQTGHGKKKTTKPRTVRIG